MTNHDDILPEEQAQHYQRLVHDLRQLYTPGAEDGQSLAHIRSLLLLSNNRASETHEATPEPTLLSRPPEQASREQGWKRRRSPRETSRYSALSTLVAVLLMALLVGSLVLVLARAHQGSGDVTGNTHILFYPNVGVADAGSLDPAAASNANRQLVDQMVYGGLVRYNSGRQIIADQAQSWSLSLDEKTWTFHLRLALKFSDGSPITSRDYVYALTRSLLPSVHSQIAARLEGNIVGASAVLSGKSTLLSGVVAIDPQTLVFKLVHPATGSFLQLLTNPLFSPLNARLVNRYGQNAWGKHAIGPGFGSGPFLVKAWNHQGQMILVPNRYYYGQKPRLNEVDMTFVKNADAAYHAFLAHQYDFIWNIPVQDQANARQQPGFKYIAALHMAAIIPPWLHGVTLNGNGLFFDWPDVSILPHKTAQSAG